MNLRPIIALAALGIAYAVGQQTSETPMQAATPSATRVAAPAVDSGEGSAAGVLTQPDDRLWPDIPLTEEEFAELQERLRKEIEARKSPAPPSKEAQPQPVAQVALPAAGGFCANGNCGPAQARRVYQVQRPVRSGILRGLFRGRR